MRKLIFVKNFPNNYHNQPFKSQIHGSLFFLSANYTCPHPKSSRIATLYLPPSQDLSNHYFGIKFFDMEIHEPKWQLSALHGSWCKTAKKSGYPNRHSNLEKRGKDSVGPGPKQFWNLLGHYKVFLKVENSLSLALESIPWNNFQVLDFRGPSVMSLFLCYHLWPHVETLSKLYLWDWLAFSGFLDVEFCGAKGSYLQLATNNKVIRNDQAINIHNLCMYVSI